MWLRRIGYCRGGSHGFVSGQELVSSRQFSRKWLTPCRWGEVEAAKKTKREIGWSNKATALCNANVVLFAFTFALF
jgi:hypothetical protein